MQSPAQGLHSSGNARARLELGLPPPCQGSPHSRATEKRLLLMGACLSQWVECVGKQGGTISSPLEMVPWQCEWGT